MILYDCILIDYYQVVCQLFHLTLSPPELFRTPGQKLKDLLAKEGGDFQRVEVKLKRWRQEEVEHNKGGAWVTKIYLADTKKWTKILGLV